MLLFYLLIVGAAAGIIPTLFKLSKKPARNVVAGIIGAFVGAFLSFGDSPMMMRYSVLGPRSLAIFVAIGFVLIAVLIEKKSDKK
jgi:uncharacterized membrane protein YeaQ/YmgE (transglycosylase-associated protein family)